MNSNHTGSGPCFEASPPIDLLPPEILSHIFTLTLPSARQILAGPWIFGQVCSFWRALSINLPTLWASITVFSNLTPRELRLLKSQLARTVSTPLELHLRFLSSGRPSPDFNRFLAELVSHSARWRAIHLEFNSEWLPHAAFKLLGPFSLSLLQELTFSGEGTEFLVNYDFLQHTPALRRVVLGSYGTAMDSIWNSSSAFVGRCTGLALCEE
ncbi:hypothetical protein DFH06DRAFT_1212674 [Mycena polygramma]|nr:hypothetical protein DFH06DRAFT_1212674 [Mycena polygramma]